jgi:hypothetical protein
MTELVLAYFTAEKRDTLGTRRAAVYLDALKELRSHAAERSLYRSSSDVSSAEGHGARVALQVAGGTGGGAS